MKGYTLPVGPAVASDGDLNAVLWKESGTNNMYVAVSHDNGLTWGPATRVDSDATGATKFASDSGLAIADGNIYACWSDDRNQAFDADLYYVISTDGGLTWSPDTVADKGLPSLGNDVKDFWVLADGPTVAFVTATEDDANAFNERLYTTISIDGGATFAPAVPLSNHATTADVDAASPALANGVVHVLFQDDSSGVNAAYYSRYEIATATLTADTLISANNATAGGTVKNDISLAANGLNLVAVFQADFPLSLNLTELSVAASVDGGLSWSADAVVGGYTPGVDDTDHPVSLALANGNFIVGFEDNRNGGDELFALTSTDGGATWTESASFGGGGFPAIAGGGDYVMLNWTGPTYPEGSQAVVSRDGGVTWSANIDLVAGQTGDTDFAEASYNSLYGNFVTVWLNDQSGANQLFAGGTRSQTLTPVGPFTAGGLINFDASGFGAGEGGNQFMVLLSTATGSALIPGDGRDIGLAVSPTLLATVSVPQLKATLAADGSASTPQVTFPGSFPVGTTLAAVGLSRNGGAYGSITDVVTITVQ